MPLFVKAIEAAHRFTGASCLALTLVSARQLCRVAQRACRIQRRPSRTNPDARTVVVPWGDQSARRTRAANMASWIATNRPTERGFLSQEWGPRATVSSASGKSIAAVWNHPCLDRRNASRTEIGGVSTLHEGHSQAMFKRVSSRGPWLMFLAALWLCTLPPDAGSTRASFASLAPVTDARLPEAQTSILVYHRFGPVVADSMTIRTRTFRWQLEYLRDHGYQVIPLREWIAWRLRLGPPPPARSVVITADDGHRSVFTDMLPLVREFGIPVTLFIYPSAISNATYAMTWEQLRTLAATGLFEIQSHTYWHPNFATEKRRLPPVAYRTFALTQLTRSKAVLTERLGVTVDVIAWPFGVYDEELLQMGIDAGYVAGVTLDRRVATDRDPVMALPRFLVTDAASGRHFAALLSSESP